MPSPFRRPRPGPALLAELIQSQRGGAASDGSPSAKQLAAPPRRRRWCTMVLIASVWLYLFAVLAVWALLRVGGDQWWFPTVMLFGPRWLYGLPLAVLAPAALAWRGRCLVPLAAALAIVVGPIMGLCLPWHRLLGAGDPTLRVLSCNIDGQVADRAKLAALVADALPDVVALQECPGNFELEWPAGWSVLQDGELVVASRYPLRELGCSVCQHTPREWRPIDALLCRVETPAGPITFCNLHLSSPHEGLSEVLSHKTVIRPAGSADLDDQIAGRSAESQEVSAWLQQVKKGTVPICRDLFLEQASGPLIVAGDFNLPTDSRIYGRCWGRYTNAFSAAGFGFGYTKWTPIRGWHYGLRIDHVLGDEAIRPCRSWVGPDVGSDHLPVLADLAVGVGVGAGE